MNRPKLIITLFVFPNLWSVLSPYHLFLGGVIDHTQAQVINRLRLIIVLFVWPFALTTAYAQTNTFPASGNVGIGTTTPNYLLELRRLNPVISLLSTNSGNLSGAIRGNNGNWLFGYSGDPGSEKVSMGSQHGTSDSRTISLAAGGFERLKILSNGNVGIGTASPNAKLAVNGNIRAKEVKVETANWPDYVFQPDYDLLPLDELSAYINRNGHLPDIPKAEAVEKDGVDLGEMNRLLLKKVEELTLHLIEHQKIINGQQVTIEKLVLLTEKIKL